jgi:hypothetical protein
MDNTVQLDVAVGEDHRGGTLPHESDFTRKALRKKTGDAPLGYSGRTALRREHCNVDGQSVASRPNTRYATIGEAVFIPCCSEPRDVEDRAVPNRIAPRSFPRQRPSVALTHNTGRNACGSLPCNRQRNNATTVARISLTQLSYIETVFGGIRAE